VTHRNDEIKPWKRLQDRWTLLAWAGVGLVILWLTYRLPLTRAVALIGGSLLLATALIWPPVLLPAIALAVPFGPTLPMGGFAVGTADLLLALLVGLVLLRGWAHRRFPWYPAPLTWPLLLYVGALLLSMKDAWSLRAAFPEFVKWLEILLFYLTLTALWVERTGKRVRELVVTSLVLAASLEALVGLGQFFLRIGPPGFLILGRFLRAYGTFAQPNPYAGYLGLVLPLALSVGLHDWGELLHHLRDRARIPVRTWGGLLFYPVAAGVIGLGLLASWSRGGWLGMVAAVGTVFALRSRRAAAISAVLLFLLMAGVVLGLLGIMPAALSQRFQGLEDWTLFLRPVELRAIPVTGANFALVERMAHWWAAYAMWRDHPLTGVGVGNYPIAYETYRMPGWKEPLGHAHNMVLHVLAESGLIGLGAYVLMWLWIFLHALGTLPRVRGRERAILVGALGGLVHLTVHNLFDNLYVHGMYLYVAVLIALLTGPWATGDG